MNLLRAFLLVIIFVLSVGLSQVEAASYKTNIGLRLEAGISTISGFSSAKLPAEPINYGGNVRPDLALAIIFQSEFDTRWTFQAETTVNLRSTNLFTRYYNSQFYELSRANGIGEIGVGLQILGGRKIAISPACDLHIGFGLYGQLEFDDDDSLNYDDWYDDDLSLDRSGWEKYLIEDKGFDAGFTLTAGIQYKSSMWGIHYYHGLPSLYKDISRMTNNSYRLGYTYFF